MENSIVSYEVIVKYKDRIEKFTFDFWDDALNCYNVHIKTEKLVHPDEVNVEIYEVKSTKCKIKSEAV
jgi:predicted site-specific integrase-resolvase